MKFESAVTPYLRPSTGVGAVMRTVLLALVPATLAYLWYFGIGFATNLALCGVFCAGFEALALRIRRQDVGVALSDYSALVTAILLAFALPPLTPFWIVACAAFFAMIVAKHLYGGLGWNLFNPAMVGYVAVLLAFPLELSSFPPPRIGDLDYQGLGIGQALTYVFTGGLPPDMTLDALTRATPLDSVRTALGQSRTMAEVTASPMFGDFGGRGWEWINNFVALGGLYLLYTRVIRWHIPVGVIAGMVTPALVASVISPDTFPGPGFHLFAGATLLGAFFIATDPVSAATSPRGRLLYGLGVGMLAWLIRTWGGYPDGIAFAILLMNMAAPTIDRFTVPRILGHDRD